MTFDFRTKMIEELCDMGWGRTKPTPEQIEMNRVYYEEMSDEAVYNEFKWDHYKMGQDSMSN